MPYITESRREYYDQLIYELIELIKEKSVIGTNTAGDLNYIFTKIIKKVYEPYSYQKINDINGLLTCIRDEFQRRITEPYEDTKIIQNGDV